MRSPENLSESRESSNVSIFVHRAIIFWWHLSSSMFEVEQGNDDGGDGAPTWLKQTEVRRKK